MNSINTPKISVIIFCYNFEKYIGECIQSILNQTLTPHEIIICDDHSTDESWKIISKFRTKNPDIVRAFRHNKNIGMIHNCNFGLGQSRGDFISWIDGDDRWLQHKLEVEWETLKRNPECKIAYSNVFTIDKNGNKTSVWHSDNDLKLPCGDAFIPTFARRFFPNNNNVFRNELIYREVYEKIGSRNVDLNIFIDWDFKIRATAKFPIIYTMTKLIISFLDMTTQ